MNSNVFGGGQSGQGMAFYASMMGGKRRRGQAGYGLNPARAGYGLGGGRGLYGTQGRGGFAASFGASPAVASVSRSLPSTGASLAVGGGAGSGGTPVGGRGGPPLIFRR